MSLPEWASLVCCRMLRLYLVFLIGVVTIRLDGFEESQRQPTLSDLKKDRAVNLRLKDDQVISDVQLVEISNQFLTYKDQNGIIKVDRFQVFRASQNGFFYSDLNLSAEDHATYGTFVSYIYAKGDVIVDKDSTTYVGWIIAESETSMSIQTRSATYDIEKTKIIAWRKQGKSVNDVESKMSHGRGLGERDYNDKNHWIDFALFLHGPWAILPQVGGGLGTNANWPVFGGIRASVGYILTDVTTFGILGQTSGYLNINIWRFTDARIYVGGAYLWRAGVVLDANYRSPSNYDIKYVATNITQNIYSLHGGIRWKFLLFEAGVELPISYKESYSAPQAAASLSDYNNIQNAQSNVARSVKTFNDISRVHFLVSFLF